jgi:predicted O-methyltransferase YrrM
MARIEWIDDHGFTLDGVAYLSMVGKATDHQMVLLKPRPLVEEYEQMIEALQPRAIIELGIYQGGSTALLAQLAMPDKLVAIDLTAGPCVPLERFIDVHELREVVVPHYGTDQADTDRLDEIVASEFDGPLDVVIDDASHLEGPSRATFNALFPYLREGGLYIIEDWGWPHIGRGSTDPAYQNVTPISALVCQLVIAAARRRRAITQVVVGPYWAVVRRGDADLTPGVFDLSVPFDSVGLEMVERMREVRTATPPDGGGPDPRVR